MRILMMAVCFLLVGCAGVTETEAVYLERDRQVVRCGPYPQLLASQMKEAPKLLRDCVSDYQRQGFNRIPRP